MPKGKHVIKGEVADYVALMLGSYKTAPEIVKLIKERYQIKVDKTTIYTFKYKPHNQKLIETKRQQYLSTVSDIPIAMEKVRLERDEAMAQLALSLEDHNERITAVLKCNKEAREELKGSQASISFNQYNQYNSLGDKEMLNKLKELEQKALKMVKNKQAYIVDTVAKEEN